MDKLSVVGKGSVVGYGEKTIPNALQPDYLDFGVTLIGRDTRIPSNISIGTNCLVAGSLKNGRVPSRDLADGESYIPQDISL